MHKVKCLYCGEYFDRDKEPAVKIKNRYAHQECYDKQPKEDLEDAEAKATLHSYLKILFGKNYNYVLLEKQMVAYNKDYGYKYSGMLGALKYFFEIQGNSVENSNYRIGIIPYIYEDARNYYATVYQINLRNQDKQIENYKPKTVEITISSPKRTPMLKNQFSFLDEEEEGGDSN